MSSKLKSLNMNPPPNGTHSTENKWNRSDLCHRLKEGRSTYSLFASGPRSGPSCHSTSWFWNPHRREFGWWKRRAPMVFLLKYFFCKNLAINARWWWRRQEIQPFVNEADRFLVIFDDHEWQNRAKNFLLHHAIVFVHVEHDRRRYVAVDLVSLTTDDHFAFVYQARDSPLEHKPGLLLCLLDQVKVNILQKMAIVDNTAIRVGLFRVFAIEIGQDLFHDWKYFLLPNHHIEISLDHNTWRTKISCWLLTWVSLVQRM